MKEYNIIKEIGQYWIISCIFAPYIFNYIFNMYDFKTVTIVSLLLTCIFLYTRARHFYLEAHKLGEADKKTLQNLFNTLHLDTFREYICNQNAWYGYKKEVVGYAYSFVEEVGKLSNFIGHKETRKAVEQLAQKIEELTRFAGLKMYSEPTDDYSYQLPKRTERECEQSKIDAESINQKSKEVDNLLKALVLNLKEEHEIEIAGDDRNS